MQGDADLQPDLLGLPGDVVAGHQPPPPGGSKQRAQHADQGRLAGAVGAQESVDLSRGDLEVDTGDGPEVAELPGDVFGGDGRLGHERSRYRSP